MAKVLPGLYELHFCPLCGKWILEAKEFSDRQTLKENSICCDAWYQWYHWQRAGVSELSASAAAWICLLSTP